MNIFKRINSRILKFAVFFVITSGLMFTLFSFTPKLKEKPTKPLVTQTTITAIGSSEYNYVVYIGASIVGSGTLCPGSPVNTANFGGFTDRMEFWPPGGTHGTVTNANTMWSFACFACSAFSTCPGTAPNPRVSVEGRYVGRINGVDYWELND